MPGIFLSYRRGDTEPFAGRLRDEFRQSLPGVTVFRDIDTIPVAAKFAEYIRAGVNESDVLIALIGPGWESAADENGGRRLDKESDFVRIEIETAIKNKIPIVPVLVGGARMPRAGDLPPSLRELTEWQNHELPSRLWKESCDRLVSALRPLVAKNGVLPSESNTTSRKGLWIGLVLTAVLLGALAWLYAGRVPPQPDVGRSPAPGPAASAAPAEVATASSLPQKVAALILAGTWALDGERKSISVVQNPKFIRISEQGTAADVVLLEVSGPNRLHLTLTSPKGERTYVEVQMLPLGNGDYSWDAKVYVDANGPKKVTLEARGGTSSDLRRWEGRIDDTASKSRLGFTAALEQGDKVLRLQYTPPNGREETLTLSKQ